MVGEKTRVNPGFTLIEITIVLAIIGALVSIVLLGQGEIRARARFNDAVDRTVAELSKIQNDANTTLNTNLSAPGQDASQVFFGKLVEFTTRTNEIKTTALWRPDDICPPGCTLTHPEAPSIFDIPWGAKIESVSATLSSQGVAFARIRTNGHPVTYVLTPGLLGSDLPGSEFFDLGTYRTVPTGKALATPAVIKLNNGRGNCANITIQPESGFIDRAYVPC